MRRAEVKQPRPFLLPYSPKYLEKLSGKSQTLANRLAISRIIAA